MCPEATSPLYGAQVKSGARGQLKTAVNTGPQRFPQPGIAVRALAGVMCHGKDDLLGSVTRTFWSERLKQKEEIYIPNTFTLGQSTGNVMATAKSQTLGWCPNSNS